METLTTCDSTPIISSETIDSQISANRNQHGQSTGAVSRRTCQDGNVDFRVVKQLAASAGQQSSVSWKSARVPRVPPHQKYTSGERADYRTIIEDDGSKQDYMVGSRLSNQPMTENYCQLKDLPTEQEVSSFRCKATRHPDAESQH